MSKSLKRVKQALIDLGFGDCVQETGQATTAAQAAAELGCTVNQIAKSIIFKTAESAELILFITAGARRVDLTLASALVGQALEKANAAQIRDITGFAIGGVSPVGHLSPIQIFFDQELLQYPIIYAAAGTPFHVFGSDPAMLQRAIGGQVATFST